MAITKKPAFSMKEARAENTEALKKLERAVGIEQELEAKRLADKASDRRTTSGVWINYRMSNDFDELAVSIHADELAARTAAMDSVYQPSKVVFVPWDGSIEDALKAAAK